MGGGRGGAARFPYTTLFRSRARQRELAGELAAKHGVVCHIAQEISWAGQHKNAWGIGVPLLDYAFLCRSEEHTSELQSQSNLVCRLLLEKKKEKSNIHVHSA